MKEHGAAVLEPGEADLLTPRQAADKKGVSLSAIYAAIEHGRLPSTRVLDRIALRAVDVESYQPIRYGKRAGAKGRGGRPRGVPMSADAKARIAASQMARWARKKETATST